MCAEGLSAAAAAVMSEKLQEISTCGLLFELLHDGEGNIHPELEPINTDAIVDVLRRRHGCDWGNNAESWAKWFLNSPSVGTPDERESITVVLRIRKIEKDALERKGAEDNDQ